ncbi:MAG: hypothetical protein IPJ77_24080 [Planctomycetes bacterium]|nr:hypothetical protein [Planctomycetota bacterium]
MLGEAEERALHRFGTDLTLELLPRLASEQRERERVAPVGRPDEALLLRGCEDCVHGEQRRVRMRIGDALDARVGADLDFVADPLHGEPAISE